MKLLFPHTHMTASRAIPGASSGTKNTATAGPKAARAAILCRCRSRAVVSQARGLDQDLGGPIDIVQDAVELGSGEAVDLAQ